MTRTRMTATTRFLIVLALLVPVMSIARAGAVSQQPTAVAAPATPAPGPVSADGPTHRRSEMALDLVSRTYDAGQDNWTIVAEATLSSNRVCLPIALNCIVGELAKPANASLTQLKCESHAWNHLLVFRDHCLKQFLFAGHHQKFRFTYTTDPGVNAGKVELAVEFGRGFLPVSFRQLATATLSVDLDVELDITKTCPTEVDSGGTLTCTIAVSYPTPPSTGPTVSGITVTDTPDAALSALLGTPALTMSSGAGTWNCGSLTCSDGELSSGESAVFELTAPVPATSLGGQGKNVASVAWTDPAPGGPRSVSDTVVVVGNGDTRLELEKTTSQTEATPGQPISWTVTLTNAGPLAASDPVVTDTQPAGVDGLTLSYDSGVGTWDCAGVSCTTATMPVGSAKFTASGTVAVDAPADKALVNEVGVVWTNDILGPDFPITAGSAVPVVAAATTTSTTTPSGSGGTGAGGAPISFVG